MFDSAHIPVLLEAIIAIVVLEMAGLALYRRITGAGPPFAENIAFLGAGLCMLAALLVLSTTGSFTIFALCMVGSLVLHVAHLVQRWRA